ncbi:MAG: LytTR family DNA-binding domain-containing protein [Sphingopyxis sp.]|uniref:LytR/AlgR family response regulator transcription factor n=1 Tax=Sphingopyxis sp. TaxID=1908224 RepID=UPI002ABC3395|nr:LytTR family DNA-binding domain-containing protein [Sphingopyxis sp.]MDZ3832322.1 LytTR family DNA-binding domain-containing protein [Sphingopyxis sp.]
MTRLKVMAVDDEELALRRIEFLLSEIDGADLVATSRDPLEALSQIDMLQPDVLLLDIHMSGLSGLELARQLISADRHVPQIIFVTAFNQHAVRAFEARAADYILKPLRQERLQEALDHARVQIERERASRRASELQRLLDELREDASGTPLAEGDRQEIWAMRGGNYVRLLVHEIEWAESERDYVHIHNHERAYLLRTTMGALHERLGAERFMRVRRSAIVRIDRVESILNRGYGNIFVLLQSGAEVRVGRTYIRQVRDRLRNGIDTATALR